jgi:aspartate kinase
VLTQGYIGATPEGDTTTMGSESSDLTATLIAGALAAEEVVIWKTVQGIYTADPELVPEAKLIKSLSFEEAEEIGRRGARILFPAVAHPILREEHDTVMRIATPMGRSERHTEMQRTLPAPRQEKPLGVAVDQNLLELRIRRALQAAPVITDAAHKRLGLERVLAEAAHVWFSGSEVRAIIPRERRSDLQSRLAASGWTVFAAEPVSAIGVVVRTPTLKQGTVQEQKTMSTVVKSLRGFPVRAIFAIESSIVAGNHVPDGATSEEIVTLHDITGSHDLIGSANVALPGDTIGGDPMLAPLADNGGPTQTHALLAGSPAIDTGSNIARLDTDQRGGSYVRVAGAAPDIGAFEAQGAPDAIFGNGFD